MPHNFWGKKMKILPRVTYSLSPTQQSKSSAKIHPETEENAQKCTGENGSRMSQSHFNGTFVGFWSCSTKLASHYFMHFDSRKEQDHRGIPPSYTGGVLRDHKVEKILKGSLDSIPSPSVKIQIMDRKVCLRCRGKMLLGVVNKLLNTKMFCLYTFPAHNLNFH